MRAVIYTNPHDGGVHVIHPASGMTVEAIMAGLGSEAYRPRIVQVSELPDDRADRALWRDTGTQVVIDEYREKYKPVPQRLSRSSMIAGAAEFGWISEDEADAWSATGDLPAKVLDAISQLPIAKRLRARVMARADQEIYRSSYLLAAVAAIALEARNGEAPDQATLDLELDAFFRAAHNAEGLDP